MPEQITSLRLAIDDLTKTFGARYAQGAAFAARLADVERRVAAGVNPEVTTALQQLRSDALLANPLLDFERLLLVQRDANKLGLPQNWEGNSDLPPNGFNNQIAVLSPVRPSGELRPLFRPEGGRFVGDVDSVNDNFRIAAPIGSFAPNAWGLRDMCGNVWEWTSGDFAPDRKAVRGGSWSERPAQATSSSRLGYRPWQQVYHVGFRIICIDSP